MTENPKKQRRRMILANDAVVVGRQLYKPGALQLDVPVSGQSNISVPGGKCRHGVYIPATSTRPDAADTCSICYLYVIRAKAGAPYTV